MNKRFIPDYHLHSCYSADCETKVESIIKKAVAMGMHSICLTDHNDLDFPDTPEKICFDLEIDDYIRDLGQIRDEVSSGVGAGFDLRIGVEQGVMPSTCEKLASYSSEHPGLDFIIASSHVVDGFDPYYPKCWVYPNGTPKDVKTLYMKYFEDMLYNVTHFEDFNVYGHIDYIFRYGPDNDPNYKKVDMAGFRDDYYPVFKDILHEILKTLIEKGKGIEINTGSLYRGMDYMHPHELILRMYKELGGEILTFGSDAHDVEHVGYHIEEAAEFAAGLGFKYYSTFKNMKPEFVKL